MNRLLRNWTIVLLSAGLLSVSCTGSKSQLLVPLSISDAPPRLAAISYWSNESEYDSLPEGAFATINPQCGIVAVTDPNTIAKYRRILADATSRGVKLLGYVRTGYGQRKSAGYECVKNGEQYPQSLAEIKKQIDTYFEKLPNIAGVFFDEASYDEEKTSCKEIKEDIDSIRNLLPTKRGTVTIAWNPGVVGPKFCYIEAAKAGEIVVVFEKDFETYAGDKLPIYIDKDLKGAQEIARQRGVATWHLVHTTPIDKLESVLARAKSFGATYIFVTDRKDWSKNVDTYGAPPEYWEHEKELLQ
jgi:hypothetical protein